MATFLRFESIWKRGTYARLAGILSVLLVGTFAVREAPVLRSMTPIRTIAARQALVRHGLIIRVAGTATAVGPQAPMRAALGRVFEVRLTVVSPGDWQIAPADLVLELADGSAIPALPARISEPESSLIFAPGVERTARIVFPLGGTAAPPASLRLQRPRTRFILEGG
jgi:hypothetical protein